MMTIPVLLAAAAALAVPVRPVATYSIVARDPATGELGVAVQSHWFSVGSVVSWAEPGVGAVATQSMVEVSYGPEGLRLMREGKSAKQALEILLAKDPQKDSRQVAMVDAKGGVAAWTGKLCIPEAGQLAGDGFSVQANMMEQATVWPAMAKAFEAAKGKPLAERLLAALDAAEAGGATCAASRAPRSWSSRGRSRRPRGTTASSTCASRTPRAAARAAPALRAGPGLRRDERRRRAAGRRQRPTPRWPGTARG